MNSSTFEVVSKLATSEGKDLMRDERLARLNHLLEPIEACLEADLIAPRHPVTFILGPPRSGTTLTSQLLARTGLFGSISNFVARFWRAPALGIRMELALGPLDRTRTASFESHRGRTDGWSEPNEFGYFWSQFFDKGQTTHFLPVASRSDFDRVGLRRAVAAMEAASGRPMVFKNNTWFSFHCDLLAEIFPSCVLVVCRRDPFFIAQSLWLQRHDLHGDGDRWWSVRPPDYEEIRKRPPLDQVAAQSVSIAVEIEASLARSRSASVVDVDYARLVAAPRLIIQEIATAVGVPTSEVAGSIDSIPGHLDSTDEVRLPADLAADLRRMVVRELGLRRPSP